MSVRDLLATDDTFREVADLLFGGGGDELIAKMNPAQSDVATHERKKRALAAGLGAVGATAGAAGLAVGGNNLARGYRAARFGEDAIKAGKIARITTGKAPKLKPIASRKESVKAAVGHEKLATGLIPLEVAGLGGELMATKILHGDAKKKVQKDLGDLTNNATVPTKRSLTMAAVTDPKLQKKGVEYSKKGVGKLKQLTTNQVEKSADLDIDVVWEGDFAKADADKQQVFGWASVVEVDGQPVVDLQGDLISPDEMEKAGYEYVMKSRKGGDMHLRDNWKPIQKSEMIESFIVTDEKRQAMGLPDSVPTGWWVGFQVRDPDVWAKVRSGERTGFSIHGHGRRS